MMPPGWMPSLMLLQSTTSHLPALMSQPKLPKLKPGRVMLKVAGLMMRKARHQMRLQPAKVYLAVNPLKRVGQVEARQRWLQLIALKIS